MKAWTPVAAVCAVAVVRAMTASPPSTSPPADEALRRRAFHEVADGESGMRAEGAKTFPTDLWSRDDDFHRREWDKARDFAGKQRVRPGDALSAVDEGLRQRWPSTNRGPLAVTVPPCNPRAIY